MIKEANIVQFIFIVATNCVFEIRQDRTNILASVFRQMNQFLSAKDKK